MSGHLLNILLGRGRSDRSFKDIFPTRTTVGNPPLVYIADAEESSLFPFPTTDQHVLIIYILISQMATSDMT